MKNLYCSLALLLLVAIVIPDVSAQVIRQPPSKERVDQTWKRRTEIDGNNVRASIFNYIFAGRTGVGQGVPFEWPKNTGRDYIALVALFIGGEVVDDNGKTIQIVDLPAFRTSPSGKDWNMLPIPGYFNDKRADGGIIAKSDDPTSWPAVWPDKLVDKVDPGWPGSWNGYFGKNQFSADQEMYYRDGDNNYDRLNYTPDTTDLTRKGLGLIIESRVMEWSQVSIQDAVFFIHTFRNDGTKDIKKVGTTIWLADLVGGDGDSQDDTPDFDLRQAVAFSLDADGISSNPAFQGAFVGAVATSFLETPGNAVDRIDNDGDSPENPQTGNGPPVTFAMIQGEITGNQIDDNGNGLIDEDSTYIAFGTQKAATFADGIDNNGNGEIGSPVVTQAMIDSASIDRWHRWPPNPEFDQMQQKLDGSGPIIHLIEVGPQDLGLKFKDNIDNDDNSHSYNNLPKVTAAMVAQAATDRFHRYRVPGTNVILYALDSTSIGKGYLNKDGLRDPGVDEGIDEMIDESRDDGVDNNNDWDPLTDDVGLDGVPNTGDFGEGDGIPTSGAGTPFPGEPHIDKTDIKEADQIGITNVQYDRAGAINFSNTSDVYFWGNFMLPGKFVDPAAIKAVEPGDFDLFVSSGFFPLQAGQSEVVSYALTFGNAVRSGNADVSGAKADALRKRQVAQLAYTENYQFAKAPIEPTVTAVAGPRIINGVTYSNQPQVTLYWDEKSEKSFDRFLAGIAGADPNIFEGYRVYRSTDPAFLDPRIITDAQGNPAPFNKPLAQFDLRDGITGYSPIAYNGVQFWLGDDTGLQHTWTDTTVTYGQKYYYAVRAYSKGYAPIDIAPAESNLLISIDNVTGQVREIGSSIAIVVPEPPSAGYLPPGVSPIGHVGGTSTGAVGYQIVDANKVGTKRYRVTFEDAILPGSGASPDTFKTKSFTLADITNPARFDTLIARSTAFADTTEQPVTDGFRLMLTNEKNIAQNTAQSGWSRPTVMNPVLALPPPSLLPGQPRPCDYQIIVGPVGTDTSTVRRVGATGYVAPAIPVDFKVINMTENKKIQFAFVELDPSSGAGVLSAVFDARFSGGTKSDYVVFLENNARDSLVITWAFSLKFDSTRVIPAAGDTAVIRTTKMFRASDVFEFSTAGQTIDQNIAKNSLDKIKVVPNPYIAAASWEERNPYTSGRGPRSIHFNHLPADCTIRIFTVDGELVTSIEHHGILDGSAEWNLLTRDSLPAAYGIYIYHVDAPGVGEKIGKFAVIK